MSTTILNTAKTDNLFELARDLLSQKNLASLLEKINEITVMSGAAKDFILSVFEPETQSFRSYIFRADTAAALLPRETPVRAAQGPLQQLIKEGKSQYWQSEAYRSRYPDDLLPQLCPDFGDYCLFPLETSLGLVGACEFTRTQGRLFNEEQKQWLQRLMTWVALCLEQLNWQQQVLQEQRQLRHERDDFRVLVDVTNAVLSERDLDDVILEMTQAIQCYFPITTLSIVLGQSGEDQLKVYSTCFIPGAPSVRNFYQLSRDNSLEDSVLRSGEVVHRPLHSSDRMTQDERALFERYLAQTQTLSIIPLRFGQKTLGVLKLVELDSQQQNLPLLQQIAERIAIAVNNAQAYQEITALKEKLVHENMYLIEQSHDSHPDFSEIVGRSAAMSAVLKQVEVVAKSDCSVLILGETGTGKELIARAIHNLSERRSQRMVKMNCAAMPAGLLESDLFGHEKGAFTGATSQRAGRFEMADKGTLFLDEVGEIPLELQPKLLRILQEREFERVGGNKVIVSDVRLIAATNRDLLQMVADKQFRSDLYYRLNVFPIVIPPLRERPEDIPQLVKFLTFKIARRMKRTIDSIPAETLRLLSLMPWPGNVRELENVIERAVLLTQGNVLNLQLDELRFSAAALAEPARGTAVAGDEESDYQRTLRVLKETNGVVSGPKGAAQRLGIKRTTLISRMKKWGISTKAGE